MKHKHPNSLNQFDGNGWSVENTSIRSVLNRDQRRSSEPSKFAFYLSSGFLNCQFDSGPKSTTEKVLETVKKNKGRNKGNHSGRPANPGLTRLFFIGADR